MPNTKKEDKNIQTTFLKEDLIQSSKTQLPFNIKTEIAKLKISVPLTELVKNESYRSQITQTLNIGEGEDAVKLNDYQLKLLLALK